jgi:hypothetical protein
MFKENLLKLESQSEEQVRHQEQIVKVQMKSKRIQLRKIWFF